MRSSLDAHRSLAKYLSLALGSDWEVRLARDDASFERPWAVVNAVPGMATPHGARQTVMRRSFSVVAYPPIGETEEEARMEAARVEDLLWRALTIGVHVGSMRPDRGRAHPLRVPLYDFDGIELGEAAPEGARDGRDFLRVDEPSVSAMADPVDDRAYVVTADLRVSWARWTGIPQTGVEVVVVGVVPTPAVEPPVVEGVQVGYWP